MKSRALTLIVALMLSPLTLAKPEDAKVLVPDRNARPPELTIAKGTEITVEDYEAKTDTFLISINEEPGVGPNFVTPENLRKAIAYNGDQADFMKNRNQMVGSIYQTKAPMPLVREDVLGQLQNKARAAKDTR